MQQANDLTLANSWEWLAALIIYIFILIILGLIVAFIMSFYFSANTIIYALLRNKVDNTPIDEVCRDPVLNEFDASDINERKKEEKSGTDDIEQ